MLKPRLCRIISRKGGMAKPFQQDALPLSYQASITAGELTHFNGVDYRKNDAERNVVSTKLQQS
jgi:hypothetical protein